jgi:P4 family phage/plasmid primase-like protien
MVAEVDYLLVQPGQDDPELRRLQRNALAYALQAANFPFTALIDSGGKSIHVVIRLLPESGQQLSAAESDKQIAEQRAGPRGRLLAYLMGILLGKLDVGVFKMSGKCTKLCRMPNGWRGRIRQDVLAVGRAYTLNEVLTYCWERVVPEVRQEAQQRGTWEPENDLILSDLRRDLLRPHRPGERGTHWMHVAKKLSATGIVGPVFHRRPSPNLGPAHNWTAPPLWWVAAYAFHHYSDGWFFSFNDTDWTDEAERNRWFTYAEATEAVEEGRYSGRPGHDRQREQEADAIYARMRANAAQTAMEADSDAAAEKAIKKQASALEKALKSGEDENPIEVAVVRFFQNYEGGILQQPEGTPLPLAYSVTEGQWKRFTGRCWEVIPHEPFEAILRHHAFSTAPTTRQFNDVLREVQRDKRLRYEQPWIPNLHATVFSNGTLYFSERFDVVHWYEGVFRLEDRVMSVLPHPYVEGAEVPKIWTDWVDYFVGGDNAKAACLQEFAGYCLVNGMPKHKFLMIVGDGGNGKGTFKHVLATALGEHNCTSVVLAELAKDFNRAMLPGKMLAVDDEGEVFSEGTSRTAGSGTVSYLKRWIGGDSVQINQKYKDVTSSILTAKLLVTTNTYPRLVDRSEGLWRRLIMFRVDAKPANEMPDVYKLLVPHMVGVVKWMVIGLQRLLANGQFTVSEQMLEEINEYRTEQDSIALFRSECIVPLDNSGHSSDVRTAYAVYKEFCATNGIHPVRRVEFSKHMGAVRGPTVRRSVYCVWQVPVENATAAHPNYVLRGVKCLDSLVRHPHTLVTYKPTIASDTIPFRPDLKKAQV